MAEEYLSVTQVADELGITRQRVLQLITDSRLKAERFANVYMIPRSALDSVRDRPTGRPPKPKVEKAKVSKKGKK